MAPPPNQLPHLSLLEEFLLLALDDVSGQFYPVARSTFDCTTAAAVLMDLGLQHRIDNDLQEMFVINPAPTGDRLIDPVLQLMALEPAPTPITKWLREISEEAEALREKALQRLVQRNILRCEDKKILWVFHTASYPVSDRREGNAIKLRILTSILSNDIPQHRDIVLVTLAHVCGLFQFILGPTELAAAEARIQQIVALDLLGHALGQAVGEIDAAMAMVTGLR